MNQNWHQLTVEEAMALLKVDERKGLLSESPALCRRI